ncbi:MAG: sigma-70 family RNA polymerase sigma factor [Chitinophagaceae bacterium]|nr:sigma-70 family RNA polymerase sigma factor [Chitinophagaceae bacterium]
MNPINKLSEEEIIQRILAGEKPLYELIVKRFNPTLYKIGRSYNYNHQDTQDLMQDSFIDAYKNLKQFEGRAHFKTWIIRIMLNNCYRKKEKLSFKNELTTDFNENAKPMFSNTQYNAVNNIQNRELGHIIENALATITEDYRIVFSLREINGLNVAETAELLGISEANVKVRLNRAKTILRNKIELAYSNVELYEFNLQYCDAIVINVMQKINDL